MFLCSITFAQNNLNSYKYILVPKQFEFQKSQDQYQFNSLTKFLFNREGFNVLFTDETYPADLSSNGCLGLKVRVNNKSSLFKTKMNIDLLDCHNKVVYATKDGISRIKDYKEAYHEALRKTFSELELVNYVYNSQVINNEIKVVETSEVKVEKTKVENTKSVIGQESLKSIEGKFDFDNWGKVVISKKEDYFTVVGGDENFQFATIYKTSKPLVYIIKWVSFKQPQLLEIDSDGNFKVDSNKGIKLFKRMN